MFFVVHLYIPYTQRDCGGGGGGISMGLIPRRRGVYFKLLLLLPATWFALTLLISFNEKAKQSSGLEASAIKGEHYPEANNNNNILYGNILSPNNVDEISGHLIATKEPPTGPGELGKPVTLPTNMSQHVKNLVDKGWTDNAFNQYVSDMISVKRSLPDVRDPL